MSVHLYTTCWNEAEMLGFFFRHYDPWVDRYIIHDDGSTDGSIEILQAHPKVELRKFSWSIPGRFATSNQILQNHVWKESRGRADWVVIVDIDEHLFVRGVQMRMFLADYKARGITLAPALGYQMLSDRFPEPDENLCYSLTRGAPYNKMNKMGPFNPDALEETNHSSGRHKGIPIGHLKFPKRDELLLLHYSYMGFDRTRARHTSIYSRYISRAQNQEQVRMIDSLKYAKTSDQFQKKWNAFEIKSVDISSPKFRGWKNHLAKKWWWKYNMEKRWWTDWQFRLYQKYMMFKNIPSRILAKLGAR